MLHICRDFLAKHPTSSTVNTRFYSLYLSSLFVRGCLGFTVVGNTNFNIDSGSITKGNGVNNANVNLGGTLNRAVQVPSGSYVVSASDIDRILALKSNSNSRLNSGLFRVSGIDSTTNSLYVQARAWLDPPPAETNLSWTLYEAEFTATANFLNGANTAANNHYRGTGNATTSRIILQSPHSSQWQLRITAETDNDVGAANPGGAACGAACSFIPGFGGDTSGDFPQAGRHLHHPRFFDVTAINNQISRTNGTLPGFTSNTVDQPGRYYMWGDDSTGALFIIGRQHGTTGMQSLVTCGLPEDESLPLPADPVHRLFSFGNITPNGVLLEVEPDYQNISQGGQLGVAMGLGLQPILCVPMTWCFLAGNAPVSSIMNDLVASDSVYLGATELYGWDLIAGTFDLTNNNGGTPVVSMEPRRLGRMPFARKGRENFNNFSTSTDPGQTWLHMTRGIYLPWSGSIIP